MKVWTTKNGTTIAQVLGGRSNAYTVSNGRAFFLVDCGVQRDWERLRRRIDHVNESRCPLIALILTHSHFDHAENAAAVKARYRAPILIHRSEGEYLLKGENPGVHGTFLINRLLVSLFGSRYLSGHRYTPTQWDILVDERYPLSDWGFHAYALHTPGHSPGSLSVVVDDEIAVAGDAVFGVFPGSVVPPFARDEKLMRLSWKALLNTGCSTFLPGHGRERDRALLQNHLYKTKTNKEID
jgi:glyoxylase-like metal-dependent hydrolase (beta-lactamase superfamily II)